MKISKKRTGIVVGILFVLLIASQLIHSKIDNPPVTGDLNAPAEVKSILKRACYDCHSNETNLKWYDKIVPVYFQVAEHIKEGRNGLNFSEWDRLAPGDQKAKLWEAVNQVIANAMPLKSYEFIHSSAKLSASDIVILKNYVTGMSVTNKPNDTAKINALQQQQLKTAIAQVPKTINGISYIADYKNWLPISTTARYDNGTMRVIFGNDVAIKAIRENNINPWPKGTIFAKVAWDEIEDSAGNVTTGAFKQVEYMIKDNQKYSSTKGWGFARFKTPKLLPYGKTVSFTTECVNCHRPMAKNDYVFTTPIKH